MRSIGGTRQTVLKRTTVFAWITGERTNLGDSLLRRPYVRGLAKIGRLEIWVNKSTPDFLDGLDLPRQAKLIRAFPVWYGRLVLSSLCGRTILVINAGEFRTQVSRAALFLPLLAASLIVRLRGGCSIWIGGSVPEPDGGLLGVPARIAGRTMDYVQWREAGSCLTAAKRSVGPDWAFLEGGAVKDWTAKKRVSCAVVLRGDRPAPTDSWYSWVRELCAEHHLSPVVVVQVRQDNDRAQAVADRLGGTIFPWPTDRTHSQQESLIRDIYSRSVLVIGDRLHALIIGATEGAVPIGWVESSRGKIGKHFDVVGIEYAGQYEGAQAGDLPSIDVRRIGAWADQLSEAVELARDDLHALQQALGKLESERRPNALAKLTKNYLEPARPIEDRKASEY